MLVSHCRRSSFLNHSSRLVSRKLAGSGLSPLAAVGRLAASVTAGALGRAVVAHGGASETTGRASLGRVVSGLATVLSYALHQSHSSKHDCVRLTTILRVVRARETRALGALGAVWLGRVESLVGGLVLAPLHIC